MYRTMLLSFVVLGFTATVQAGKPTLQQLRDQCETAREAKLAPEREALIQACIQEKAKSAEHCQRFYADYGAGGRTAAGAGRAPLYNDLPECEALFEAEKENTKR